MKGYDTLQDNMPSAPPPYSPAYQQQAMPMQPTSPQMAGAGYYPQTVVTTPPQQTRIHMIHPGINQVNVKQGRECCCCCCSCPFWVCCLIIALIVLIPLTVVLLAAH